MSTEYYDAAAAQASDELYNTVLGQVLPTHTMDDVRKLVMINCVDVDEDAAEMWLAMREPGPKQAPAQPEQPAATPVRVINPTFDWEANEMGAANPVFTLDYLLPVRPLYIKR